MGSRLCACVLVLLAACAEGSKSPAGAAGAGGTGPAAGTTGAGGAQAGASGTGAATGGSGGTTGLPTGGTTGASGGTGGSGGTAGSDAQVPDAGAADTGTSGIDAATPDAGGGGTDAGGGGTGGLFDAPFDDLGGWTESGSGWGTNDAPGNYPASGSGDPVAHSDNCNSDGCWMETTDAIDLSGYTSATLSFLRYIDTDVDADEYLAVQVYHQGAWLEVAQWLDGDDTWHAESFDLTLVSGFDISLATDFKIRFEAQTSGLAEDIYVDDVRVTTVP